MNDIHHLKIGMVPYINALPFSLAFSSSLVFHPPAQLNDMLQAGLLDMALTSSILGDMQECFYLSDYGIAATQQVLSVNLYSPVSPEELSSIALDSASATSVRLLEILYAYYWKTTPRYVTRHTEHQGYLLIGDAALAHTPPPGWLTIDLCAVWNQWTQLPFLFALFVYRASIDIEWIQHIEKEIEHSLSWSEQHFSDLVSQAQIRTRLPIDLVSTYYHQLHYRLTEADWAGFRLFQQYHQQLRDTKKQNHATSNTSITA